MNLQVQLANRSRSVFSATAFSTLTNLLLRLLSLVDMLHSAGNFGPSFTGIIFDLSEVMHSTYCFISIDIHGITKSVTLVTA
jgi:hypothetical protein